MDDASGKAVKIKKKKKYCKSTISRNENYLCQGDSLAGKFDQPNPGSRQTDGIMAHESSTEIMKIFGDRNRQLVPVSEKYDAKFIHCIKKVISCKPNLDVNSEEEKENCIPYSKASEKCLENLCKEAAKMKGHRATLLVPSASIKKLFAVLERNIAKGVEMLHTDNVIEGLEKPNVTKEKLMIAEDSALAILYILTSPDMPRNIYSEVILERVAMFLKYYGEYILPASSPTNEHELKSNDFGKLQEAGLYDKFKKILSLFLELIGDVFLPENIVESIILMIIPACYYCTSKGCQIFLKFLGKIFLKYQHLKLQMLDEILGKNSGIPSCKKCVYKYELQLGEYVHMSSVIVLHIIQCDLLIPETDGYSLESSSSINKDILKQLDKVTETATYFLSSLIDRCAKNADGLCVFVKFVMDLLLMTSKPQWPVVEVMLNTLGKLLLLKLPETIDTVDRLFSVDILCLITVGLKKNAAAMQLMPETENKILTLVSDKQLGIAENKKYIFQKVLLGFFSSHTQDNNARLFHLLEWYSDEIKSSTSTECTGKQEDVNSGTKKAFQIPVDWRQFLVSQLEQKSQNEIFDIGIKDIESVCWALSFSRSYSSNSFSYVNHIVSLLTDVSTAVRTKAVKCIVQILEADANILQEKGFLCIIKVCFRDQSSHVRESVVELVGKLIMHHPEMTEELYDLLVARIVDTSITVRKQVVRILKTFCCHNIYPAKVPDMCFKMVKRINDDESIKKLVVEVFQDLWFKPTEIKASLSRRVSTIVTVVSISDGLSQSCLKELFENISVLQMKTGSSGITTGCKQLIGNFVVIIQDESSERQYVLQCVTALHLLSQVWPQLLVKHSGVLKTLLCRKCSVPQDYQVTSIIARMLTQIVPFLKNSCEFLVQLEKDIENLVMYSNSMVIESCILCLASIFNVTQNCELVHKYFNKYFTFLSKYLDCTLDQPTSPRVTKCCMFLQTALFIIALLFEHFDFTESPINKYICKETKKRLFDILLNFIQHDSFAVQKFALKAVGSLCIQNNDFINEMELKKLYKDILKDDRIHVSVRAQVLKNVEMYLVAEERNLSKDSTCSSASSKYGSLKKIGDSHSGLATSLIQFLLPEILNSLFCSDCSVRRFVFTIIQLMLRQGLVYRPQVLSHVIAMTTDFADSFVRCGAENLLKDSGRQIGTLQSKFQSGICLSFNFQMILPEQSAGRIIRGFCIKEGVSSAVNDFLYLLIRPWKQYRNTFLSVLVKNFDDSAYKCLSKMLYLADNLAHFSYGSQDEVLFLLNNITVVLSVFCANLQKLFNEKVKSDHSVCTNASGDRCDKMHLTDSTEILQEFIDASQGCILLLLLKEHLQKIYAINDEKIFHYTTSTSTKGYEKVVHKTGNFSFEPHPIIEKMKCLDVQKSSWDDLEQQVQYIKQFILMSDQGVERGSGQDNSSESEKY